MKTRFIFFLVILSFSVHGYSKTEIYFGPHFNYSRLHFNNPSHLQGYLAGVSTGIERRWNHCFCSIDFESSWNAGPFTGDPCQESDLIEYFLELKLAGIVHCWECFHFEPYIGFGWDQFNNIQDPDTADLRYCYDKLFIPIGFFLKWIASSRCSQWGIQFEFRPDVYDRLHVEDESLHARWGYAFRVQAPFKRYYQLGHECFSLAVVPFYDWTKFGRARVENFFGAQLVIPHLSRWNLGLRALVLYQF